MKQIPVFILGAGGVGRELLQQIIRGRGIVAGRNQFHFNVVGVADSESWLWSPDGLTDSAIKEGLQRKLSTDKANLGTQRPPDKALLEQTASAKLEKLILVDVTARDGMEPILTEALAMGYGVVLANKKPLAGAWETAQTFYHHPRLRHESTVGGGQPVIATMRTFLDTGDKVHLVEGQLSGTLGYICNQLDAGIPFSQAVSSAKAHGYTEPDPREDLGGMDVCRKLLILGRLAGWQMETTDIEVSSLVPSALAHLSVAEFMQATVAMDAPMQERVAVAQQEGQLLRFVGEVANGKGHVGLKGVPASSPTAHLKYISFQTDNYYDEPLLIAGKGAGVEMTASGVLGDMISLGREM